MTLEEIEDSLPWGFHDAYLTRIETDWAQRQLALELRLMIAEHQETDQLARVTVTGLHFFVAFPPSNPAGTPRHELPWIDAGPGRFSTDADVALPPTPEGHFLHHLYIREDWQTFYICARDASLEWLERKQ